MAAPDQGPLLAEAVCEYFNYETTCYDEYSVLALGSVFSQVVSLANVGGYDGQVSAKWVCMVQNIMERKNLCSKFKSLCPIPSTVPLNLTSWFTKPKPNPLPPPKQPSGERLKVLHISDIHIDPREHALPCSFQDRSCLETHDVLYILQDTQREPRRTVLRACVAVITHGMTTLLIKSCCLLHATALIIGNLLAAQFPRIH